LGTEAFLSTPLRRVVGALLLAIAYFAAGKIGVSLLGLPDGVTPAVFAPAGLARAGTVLFGPWMALGVAAGQLALSKSTGAPTSVAIALATGHALSAWLVAKLLRQRGFRPSIARVRDAATLTIAGPFFGQILSAAIGVAALHLAGQLPGGALASAAVSLWLANVLGELVVGVPLLLFVADPPRAFGSREGLRTAAAAALLGVAASITFGVVPMPGGTPHPVLLFIVLPLVLTGAIRFGPRGGAVASVIVLVAALAGNAEGRGPFADLTIVDARRHVSAFVASSALTSMFVAALFAERKRIEEELRHAKLLAEEASRVKTDFLASMSHEIRTPMNAVIGMTSMLFETDLTPEQREYAETIRQSGAALLALIGDILDLSRIESSHVVIDQSPFDVDMCVENAIDLVAHRAAEKHLELGYEIAPETPKLVVGDAARVRQILVNLLGNAVKFTHAGEVTVAVKPEGATEGSLDLRFDVRDTGIGIAPEQLAKLFVPFTQADASTTRNYGGSGLGLAISKTLAGLMGGAIEVTSARGEGSTFSFKIRVKRHPRGERAPAPEADLSAPHVLVVDDNATSRRILSQCLRACGWRASVMSSGAEAIAAVEGGEVFDAAILDMEMPGMSGAELAAALRRRSQERALPIVIASATRPGDRLREAGLDGTVEWVTKPIKPARLRAALARALGESAAAEPAPSPRSPIDSGLARRNPLRILLAEDHGINQKLALSMMELMGYHADLAANGLEALDALRRQPYDVVLMDLHMPEMDGLTATRRIRADFPVEKQPRIVAMTAGVRPADRRACAEAGMDGYLAKPFQVAELQAVLEQTRSIESSPPEPMDAATEATTAARSGAKEPPSVLDPQRIGELRRVEDATGQPLVSQLIDHFLVDESRLLEELQEAVAAGDIATSERLAHSLKGSAATLGADQLAAAAHAAEKAFAAREIQGAAARVELLTEELARVKPLLLKQKSDARPAMAPDARPAMAPDARPAMAPAQRPAVAPDARPAMAPDARPAMAPDARPAMNAESRPAMDSATD